MAKEVGEESSYILIMGYYSLFVHCNSLGMASFFTEKDKKVYFDSSASLNEIEFVLNQAREIFVRIAADWTMCYNIDFPDNILKFIKQNSVGPEKT